MLISILLPTRDRPSELIEAVQSLLGHARQPHDIQVCYATDSDDIVTQAAVSRFRRPADTHVVSTRKGYDRLHEYCNSLLRGTSGRWLMMWNDDAQMRTPLWDDVIRAAAPDVILDPQTTGTVFPIVPAVFVDEVGHWSLNAHTDSWWELIGLSLGVLTPVPIEIAHEPNTAIYGAASAEFFEPEMTALRERDQEAIRRFLS